MKINKRYTRAKQMYEAYTLPEVVELLQAAGQSRESEQETQLDIAEGNFNRLQRKYSCQKQQYNKLSKQYDDLCILHYKEELEAFRVEYCERKHNAEQEKASLASAKAEFRSQMKQGIINNLEYQHAITPLKRHQRAIEYDLITFIADKTVALHDKGHISVLQIDNYINHEEPN